MKAVEKGKLIVIDGTDGSGKATQTKIIKKKLAEINIKTRTIDFPRYYDNFFGKLIGEYLRGDYGDFIKNDPRITSVLYAVDRFESSQRIKEWLNKGYWVIADRYVSANQIHQGSKLADSKKRKNFLKWLDTMEYEVFKIPRPDLVVFLDVPVDISRAWLEKKSSTAKKSYLNGKKDVAEKDLVHLRQSAKTASDLAKSEKNWIKISCCNKNGCLSSEEIGEKIFQALKEKITF